MSVTNSSIIKPNEILFDISVDKNFGIWNTISKGISRSFNFEVSIGKSKKDNIDNSFYNQYIGYDLQNLRFGGKVILQIKINFIQ